LAATQFIAGVANNPGQYELFGAADKRALL
jgi:hypothetical protein